MTTSKFLEKLVNIASTSKEKVDLSFLTSVLIINGKITFERYENKAITKEDLLNIVGNFIFNTLENCLRQCGVETGVEKLLDENDIPKA